MNIPLSKGFHINLRANWVSERKLYSRNPLRAQDKELGSYTVFDLNLGYTFDKLSLGFKINNLFDKEYFNPGNEQGDSGDDFTNRALGFRNSLLPQLKRHFSLTARFNF